MHKTKSLHLSFHAAVAINFAIKEWEVYLQWSWRLHDAQCNNNKVRSDNNKGIVTIKETVMKGQQLRDSNKGIMAKGQ